MAKFSEEMSRLGADLRRARDGRSGDLRRLSGEAERLLAGTRSTLTRAAASRLSGAKELAARLHGSARKRAEQVKSFLTSERKTQLQRAHESRRALRAALSACHHQVEEIRAGGSRMVHAARTKRYEEGIAAKDRLVQFVTGLKSQIGGALGALEHGRCDFAADLRRGAQAFHATLAQARDRRTAQAGTGAELGHAAGSTAPAEPFAADAGAAAPPAPGAPGSSLPFELSLKDLDLPERINAALGDAGVRSLEQLTARTHEELLAIPGIGQAAARDVERFLRRRGHRLKG